jgi:hypothetical protein
MRWDFRAILLHCLELPILVGPEVATSVFDSRRDELGYGHADSCQKVG